MKDLKKTWKSIPMPVKVGIYGVAAWILYRQGSRILTKLQLKQRLLQYQNAQIPVTYTTSGGQQVTQTINLASVAGDIEDALYNNDWFGATEDETRAVNAVKTVPKALIPQLEATYLQLYNKDLRADLLNYLSSSEWSQISFLFS